MYSQYSTEILSPLIFYLSVKTYRLEVHFSLCVKHVYLIVIFVLDLNVLVLYTRKHTILSHCLLRPSQGAALAAARPPPFCGTELVCVFPPCNQLYGCRRLRRDDFSRASITPHSPIRRGKREMREVRRGSWKVGGGSYNTPLFPLALCACLAI